MVLILIYIVVHFTQGPLYWAILFVLSPDNEEFCLYTPLVCESRPLVNRVSGRVQCTGNPDNHTFCIADGRPKSAPVVYRSRLLYVLSFCVYYCIN